jgi:hypothetical protein
LINRKCMFYIRRGSCSIFEIVYTLSILNN